VADKHASRNRPHPAAPAPSNQPAPHPAALTCHRCGATFDSIREVLAHLHDTHLGGRARVEAPGEP